MRDGILSRTTNAGAAYYGYDGNGNVTLLTDANGSDVGHYRYDAFGQTLEAWGARGTENPYRFSTKELHGPSGLVDFGFRFYSPSMGRWMNRDPLGENGGVNLYAMVGNNPINAIDEYGEDAYVSYNRKTNRVVITLPITFKRLTSTPAKEANAAISQFKKRIMKYWSGKKGKYKVTIRITNKPVNYTTRDGIQIGLMNTVYLHPKGQSVTMGGSLGYWYMRPYDQQFTGAHEAGHFMGLGDFYDKKTKKPYPDWKYNIMGAYAQPVEERNITDILNGPDEGGQVVIAQGLPCANPRAGTPGFGGCGY